MALKTFIIEGNSFEPHHNLALEKYLFDSVKPGEVVMYLWQNEKTIVCGRNQNVYKECHLTKLFENGGHLARRLSGGGAVYHDVGNLNFTFIAGEADYDLEKQLSVIITACRKFGVPAALTGRNDILADGRKFSGNAFYKSSGKRYHHGTIMINVDFSKLSDYLNVDRSKLEAKGIESVRSRVGNLSDFSSEITIETMKTAMMDAFAEIYACNPEKLKITDKIEKALIPNTELYGSDEWLYGKKCSFTNEISKRFPWGDFQLKAEVKNGIINDAVIYSDSLDGDFILSLSERILGCNYSADALCRVIEKHSIDGNDEIYADIKGLIKASI